MNKPYYYDNGNVKLVNYGFATYDEFIGDKKKMAYKKVEDKIFKFEEINDSIEGTLLSKETSGIYDNEVYKIETKDGVFTVFSTTVLSSQMTAVNIGDKIKIVYMGTKKNSKPQQQPIKLFDVYVDDE
jgi:hypothetical protein